MNRLKRAGYILLTAFILLQMVGCGGKAENTAQTTVPKDDYVYVPDFKPLNIEGYEYIGNMMIGNDNTVFLSGIRKDGGTDLFSMKMDDNTPQKLSYTAEEGMNISGLGKDAEGNILLGLMRYSEDGEGNSKLDKVELQKVSVKGEILETVDASALANVNELYFNDFLADDAGNYYLSCNKSIYVLDSSGNMVCELKAEEYISNMFALRDGRIIAAYFGNEGWQLQEVSLAQKSLVSIKSGISFEYGTYTGGTDTDLLYTQDTILYTANLQEEEPVKILNWVESDINSLNLQDFKILEDGRIMALSNDMGTGTGSLPELAVLTKTKRSEVPEKKILTYGAVYLPYFTNQDIVAFNKQSKEYRVEIKEYGDDSTDLETKRSLLSADLASGNGPDIIDMFYDFIPLEEFISMEVLEDLNPYLEKDEVLNKEDFVESVYNVFQRDEKLYAIMSGFGIRTVVGKVSDVGTGTSWTVDDMIALIESKPKDIEIIPYSSKGTILSMMCSLNMGQFVNKETGECNFENEEFEKILEFANRFPKEFEDNAGSEIEKIRSGEQLLSDVTISSVQLFQMYEYMFGEEINFIGYPTVEKSGSIVTPYGTTVGMNAQSENKEGVWEFIRFNLLEDKQKTMRHASGVFPILKSALEDGFAKEMEAEYYEDADGNKKEKAKATWGTNDFSLEVFAATKEQADRVKMLIDTAGNDRNYSSKIISLIDEEAQAYFEGQKSAQDVAALIQKRVQVYLNETN